jgi:adenylyltransferase/sulfurtransferase
MQDSHSQSQTARGPTGVADGDKRDSLMYVVSSIPEDLNISCQEYSKIRESGKPHVLLDVRVKQQFDICSLEGAVNIPYASLSEELGRIEALSNGSKPVYCICRRGILSVEATRMLAESMATTHPRICSVKNVAGGVTAWRQEVDDSFPKY